MHKDAKRATVFAIDYKGRNFIDFCYFGNGLKRCVRQRSFERDPRSASYQRLYRAIADRGDAQVRPTSPDVGWIAYVGYGKGD